MSIYDKLERLKLAEDEFETANSQYNRAANKKMDALNKLKEARRAFDAEVVTIREDSVESVGECWYKTIINEEIDHDT